MLRARQHDLDLADEEPDRCGDHAQREPNESAIDQVTSDTPTDGAAAAFLFAMVASGAFLGPAIAIAVGTRGHKVAAGFWWLLATLSVIANRPIYGDLWNSRSIGHLAESSAQLHAFR